jgi:hypothetical protein
MSENQPLLGARLEGKTSVQEDESSGAADCLWEDCWLSLLHSTLLVAFYLLCLS